MELGDLKPSPEGRGSGSVKVGKWMVSLQPTTWGLTFWLSLHLK